MNVLQIDKAELDKFIDNYIANSEIYFQLIEDDNASCDNTFDNNLSDDNIYDDNEYEYILEVNSDILLNHDEKQDIIYYNYYSNTNSFFKKKLKNNRKYQQLFNFWCYVLLGNVSSFNGKFNNQHISICHNLLYNNSYENYVPIREYEFLQNIFNPIINNAYARVSKKKYKETNNVLNKYKLHYKQDLKNNNDTCCICAENLKINQCYELSCNHMMHRNCLKKWLCEKDTCPICRASI
jgi:hypothetical protein